MLFGSRLTRARSGPVQGDRRLLATAKGDAVAVVGLSLLLVQPDPRSVRHHQLFTQRQARLKVSRSSSTFR